MLPTFVIGLREGLEAALIVGIIAAFLRKQGRRDLVRWVLAGVGTAVLLCLAAGLALDAYSHNLPQRQQEGLETVIGVLAVGMVSYMCIWMKRNSRHLKGQLEGLAADALHGGSGAARAMVLMAFLAVIREGLETVVFLLAAFNEADSPRTAGLGVILGIALAVALGYGIYRGGVRINLSKFFRATGLVLVLVAAGIVVNALHTAHEAGWLDIGQGSTVDLSWLVRPGSVQASLLTGMLGIQSHPVVIEVVGWLAYLIPVGLYVAWPPGRPAPARLAARIGLGVAALAAVTAVVLVAVTPPRPTGQPTTTGGAISAQVQSRVADTAVVRTQKQNALTATTGAETSFRLVSTGLVRRAGVRAEQYVTTVKGTGAQGQPASLTPARAAALNHDQLPLGTLRDASGRVSATYADAATLTVWLDVRTDRVLDVRWSERVTAKVQTAGAPVALTDPIATGSVLLPAATVTAAVAAADSAGTAIDHRSVLSTLTGWSGALAVVALFVAIGFGLAARRRPETSTTVVTEPKPSLVRS